LICFTVVVACIFALADDTQDAAHEEELTTQVKEWICSKETGSIYVSDVLSNFPDISMVICCCSVYCSFSVIYL